MPTAGWCAECNGYAWVCSDGGCDMGHSRSSLRGLYETQPDSSSGRPLAPPPSSGGIVSPSVQHACSSQVGGAGAPSGQAVPVDSSGPEDEVGAKLRMQLNLAAAWCGVIGGLTAINSFGSRTPIVVGLLSPRLLVQAPGTSDAAGQASGLFVGLFAAVVFFALSYFVRIGRMGALWAAAALYGIDLLAGVWLVGFGDTVGLALRVFVFGSLIVSGVAIRRLASDGDVGRLAAPDKEFGTLTPGRFGRAVLIGVGVTILFVAVLVSAIKLFAR